MLKVDIKVVWKYEMVSYEGSYNYILDLFFHFHSDVSTPAVHALGILIGRNYDFCPNLLGFMVKSYWEERKSLRSNS